jgi:hypothetical protein
MMVGIPKTISISEVKGKVPELLREVASLMEAGQLYEALSLFYSIESFINGCTIKAVVNTATKVTQPGGKC